MSVNSFDMQNITEHSILWDIEFVNSPPSLLVAYGPIAQFISISGADAEAVDMGRAL